MKILLLGEYSGLYSNLKDGLIENGHEVVIASGVDGFKNLKVDVQLAYSGTSFSKVKTIYSLISSLNKLSGFDVVQTISPLFTNSLVVTRYLYEFIKYRNDSFYLSVAGDDSVVLEYWKNKNSQEFDLYFKNIKKYDGYNHEFLWGRKKCLLWNVNLAESADGIIPIMYEYHKPYESFNKCSNSIPIPININKIKYDENRIKNRKLVVFHGLNRYGAKGTKYIQNAFEILNKKYPNDLELVIDGKMSYEKYKHLLKKVNVIVDQTHSNSLAMNSLISMAMGKVVLGGNTGESMKEFGYTFNPAINIDSNENSIINAVESILENRHRIVEVGEQSRLFVEKYHDYKTIAQRYIDVWSNI